MNASDIIVGIVINHLPVNVDERISVLRALLDFLPKKYPRRAEIAEILHHYEAAQRAQLQFKL